MPRRTLYLGLLLLLVAGFASWWAGGGGLERWMPGPSSSPAPIDAPTLPLFEPLAELEPFAELPGQITSIVAPNDTTGRIMVTGKRGQIWAIHHAGEDPDVFVDLTESVGTWEGEQGLLSVAFAPDYYVTGRFYVNYTDAEGATIVARLVAPEPTADTAGPLAPEVILRVEQPYANHNGGQLQFGPDGMLYIGMGDGGSGGDPLDAGEDMSTLLGKLLRIDVSGAPDEGSGYAVPADNPYFATGRERREIFAHGLRNPWRFSFDVARGWIWVADVGQNAWEEINGLPILEARAAHFGWNTMEGRVCFDPPEGCNTTLKVDPVHVYHHDEGCSVTGGYVVDDPRWGELAGAYFYADFCSGRISALVADGTGAWTARPVVDTGANPATFGLGQDGTLYVGALDGRVWTVVPRALD